MSNHYPENESKKDFQARKRTLFKKCNELYHHFTGIEVCLLVKINNHFELYASSEREWAWLKPQMHPLRVSLKPADLLSETQMKEAREARARGEPYHGTKMNRKRKELSSHYDAFVKRSKNSEPAQTNPSAYGTYSQDSPDLGFTNLSEIQIPDLNISFADMPYTEWTTDLNFDDGLIPANTETTASIFASPSLELPISKVDTSKGRKLLDWDFNKISEVNEDSSSTIFEYEDGLIPVEPEAQSSLVSSSSSGQLLAPLNSVFKSLSQNSASSPSNSCWSVDEFSVGHYPSTSRGTSPGLADHHIECSDVENDREIASGNGD